MSDLFQARVITLRGLAWIGCTAGLVLLLGLLPLSAVATTWTGTTSGVWSTGVPSNWSAGYSNGDDVDFDDTGINTTISVSGTVAPNSITFNNSAVNYVIGGTAISGTTGLTKSGTGTVQLTASNTFTGKTVINEGVLSINNDARLGTAPGSPVADQLTIDGGTLLSTGNYAINANRGITLGAGGATFDFIAANNLTYGGVISGSGGFTVTGGGRVLLSNPNTYTGLTHIIDGQVHLKGGAAEEIFGGTTQGTIVEAQGTIVWADHGPTANEILVEPVTLNGGMLIQTASTNGGISGNVTLTADSFVNGNAASFSIFGDITGTGGLTIGGGGTKRFRGDNNTYSGPTILNQGTLQVYSNSSLGNTSELQVNNPNVGAGNTVRLDLDNANQTIGSLSSTIATPASGVNNAILDLGSNHQLTINQTVDGTFEGAITGNTGRIVLGAASTATLNLTGENTYGGGTTVSGGTLLVNNSTGSGTGTGTVLVEDTGTLGGNGTIAGSLVLNSGGTLTPGNSAGILTVQGGGGITMNSGSIFAVEIGGSTPGLHDQVIATGPITLGGLLDVSFIGGEGVTYDDELVILAGSSLTGVFSNAPTEGSTLTFDGVTFSVSYLNNQVTLSNFEIPEPSSLTLLGLGVMMLVRKRRRTQN